MLAVVLRKKSSWLRLLAIEIGPHPQALAINMVVFTQRRDLEHATKHAMFDLVIEVEGLEYSYSMKISVTFRPLFCHCAQPLSATVIDRQVSH